MTDRSSVSVVAWIAVAGVLCHAAAFGLLHLLDPGIDPVRSIISDYVGGGYPALARVAFFAFAVIWGALAVALGAVRPRRRLVLAGRILFGIAVIGVLLAAFVPSMADPREAASSSVIGTLSGRIGRPALFVGVLLVSVGVRRIPGWERTARILVLLAALAAVGLGLTLGLLLEAGFGGVGQRVIFVLLYVWAVLISLRILASGREDVSG